MPGAARAVVAYRYVPLLILEAEKDVLSCKVMMVIATSGVVQPAASLPYHAQQAGAEVVEINVERAFPDAKFFVEGKAEKVLPEIIEKLPS